MNRTSLKSFFKEYWPHIVVFSGIVVLVTYVLTLQLAVFSPTSKQKQTANSQNESASKQANPDVFQTNQAPELPADLQAAVDAAQMRSTVDPAIKIEYSGVQPSPSRVSIPIDSVVAVSNLTNNPITVNFSSGASMTLGGQGTLEYTISRAGKEEITIIDQDLIWLLSLSVENIN